MHSIVSERNFEDRVAAIQRVFDLMYIFDYLSNEQGHLEARGALISSSVFRLTKALEVILQPLNSILIVYTSDLT